MLHPAAARAASAAYPRLACSDGERVPGFGVEFDAPLSFAPPGADSAAAMPEVRTIPAPASPPAWPALVLAGFAAGTLAAVWMSWPWTALAAVAALSSAAADWRRGWP